MANVVWRGHKNLERGKDSWDFQATKTSVSVSWHGPYAKCLSRHPKVSDSISGFDPELKVTSVKVVELDGEAGRIDAVLECGVAPQDSSSTAPLGEPTYENEWCELQKPIETHPRCGVLNPERPYWKDGVAKNDASTGGKQRTWEDWQELTSTEEDIDGDYIVQTGVTGGWTLDEYKSLKERGVESYVAFQPVIRRTTSHLARPLDLGDQSGKQSKPPAAANFSRIEDYEWLGGPDRCTRNGRTFTRTTEWQGAEKFSNLLYKGFSDP